MMYVWLVVFVVAVYVLVEYNVFVKLNNLVKEAFATMDVYLKKRWDLVPNLVETVKGYSMYEKDTLAKIAEIRNTAYENMSLKEKLNANEEIEKGITRLMMIAENYPDLQASQNYLDLSKQLVKVEDDIANARKYYNAVVRNLDTKIQMFPSNLIAKLFGFKEVDMFEVTADERENVNVKVD